jgi:threonine synthase
MAKKIQYYSTNQHLSPEKKILHDFPTALLQGLAPDDGLYMPTEIPTFEAGELWRLRGKNYATVATTVLHKFLEADLAREDVARMCETVYTFPIPVEFLHENLAIARLDQGITASFKDFAAQMMAQWIAYFKPKGEKSTILVATSGDTGSAVGEAFKNLPDTKVVILYPAHEVSAFQKHQLDTVGGNTQAVALEGKFDDCQAFVKQAFADTELASLNLSSANSINIGRVLPQVVYYVYLWLQIAENEQEKINFCVPSGNLGNSLGCEIARRMGLPVGKIIIATNQNDSFHQFLQTGVYQKIEPSRECISNAMNVGNPSNLARYFELYGGCIDKYGKVHHLPDIAKMRESLLSYVVSDEATLACIQQVYEQYQTIIEPHGAVGLEAIAHLQLVGKTVCLETAHPAKFADIVTKILPIEIPKSKSLQEIENRVGKAISMPLDYIVFKQFLTQIGA